MPESFEGRSHHAINALLTKGNQKKKSGEAFPAFGVKLRSLVTKA
ncbi:MAG: hypothetical protein AAF722_19580 [Cyanobacteria bacterium P01_C01_bin.70]